jgi:hypothetical protein
MNFGVKWGLNYGAVHALRKAAGKGAQYSSNCIIGQDLTLEEYCEAIADAKVLASEPGQFSYGLGALVVGRICEVAFERLTNRKERFSQIMKEMLFDPLKMDSAAFYLEDGDPRIETFPQLYGGVLRNKDKI